MRGSGGVISVSSLPLNHNRLHGKVLCHSSTLRHEPLAFGSIPCQCSKVDRISLLSTLETQNHPVNTALSTCQPSNTLRQEIRMADNPSCSLVQGRPTSFRIFPHLPTYFFAGTVGNSRQLPITAARSD